MTASCMSERTITVWEHTAHDGELVQTIIDEGGEETSLCPLHTYDCSACGATPDRLTNLGGAWLCWDCIRLKFFIDTSVWVAS